MMNLKCCRVSNSFQSSHRFCEAWIPEFNITSNTERQKIYNYSIINKKLAPISTYIFSSLFSLCFLLNCLREFAQISRHFISADHSIHSLQPHIWLCSDIVGWNLMLVTIALVKIALYSKKHQRLWQFHRNKPKKSSVGYFKTRYVKTNKNRLGEVTKSVLRNHVLNAHSTGWSHDTFHW